MKTIGIMLNKFNINYKDLEVVGMRDEMIAFLRHYDVNVITIPCLFNADVESEYAKVCSVIDLCDGVIFPGGLYVEPILEKAMRYCYDKNIPTLGACLGIQIMAKTFGGTVEEIGNLSHDINADYAHEITIEKDSKLYEIMQKERIKVNSRHVKCVKNTTLSIVAKSDDGIIEAIEDKDKKFFIGVQWHPESKFDDEFSRKLIEAFISAL